MSNAPQQAIEQISCAQIERVIDVKTHLDPAFPFAEQARALSCRRAGSGGAAWADGLFSLIIRLRPAGGATQQYEVAEIINLQAVSDEARRMR
ncbi:MAG: hypothetical protein JNJ50_19860 [Acidobacteria bacterium]|nr:hypothetical protein [Acidobacteriota bacterium]